MRKIAIFLRNTETNVLELVVQDVDEKNAKERHGSMRKYLEYIYSVCVCVCVEDFRYIDGLRINL